MIADHKTATTKRENTMPYSQELQAGLNVLSRRLGSFLVDEPRRANVLSRTCPTCSATAGNPCITKSGNVTKPHKPR